MEAKKSKQTIIAYKGKLLLICRDEISTSPSSPTWGFLNTQNVKELRMKKVETKELGSNTDFLVLRDEQVNQLLRKEGWRFEFYKVSELPKLQLTEDTKLILSDFKDKIGYLLSE